MLGLLYTARCASCLLTFEGQVVELRLAEARRHVSAARELAQRGVADAAVQVRVQLDLRLGCGRVGEYGVIKHPAAARRLGSGRCHSGLGAWGRPAAGSVPLPACRWQRAAGSVLLAAGCPTLGRRRQKSSSGALGSRGTAAGLVCASPPATAAAAALAADASTAGPRLGPTSACDMARLAARSLVREAWTDRFLRSGDRGSAKGSEA